MQDTDSSNLHHKCGIFHIHWKLVRVPAQVSGASVRINGSQHPQPGSTYVFTVTDIHKEIAGNDIIRVCEIFTDSNLTFCYYKKLLQLHLVHTWMQRLHHVHSHVQPRWYGLAQC